MFLLRVSWDSAGYFCVFIGGWHLECWKNLKWSPKSLNCWENSRSTNKLLGFYANERSLNELIGYVTYEGIPFLKMDLLHYPPLSSTVLCIGRIFISELERLIAKQPIKIPTVLKTIPSGLGLWGSFNFCSQIWYVINFLKETSSISNCCTQFGLPLNQAKTI